MHAAALMAALSAVAAPDIARAAPCGTIAAPTACSVTVSNVTYTFTNFTLTDATASGGATVYTAADVAVAAASGGGQLGLLTFSKVADGSGGVFSANGGQSSAFTVHYEVTLSPAAVGTVAFASPFLVSVQGTTLGSGSAQARFVLDTIPTQAQCLAHEPLAPQSNCLITPGQPLALTAHDLVNINGSGAGANSAALSSFSNRFDATFVATPPAISAAKTAELFTDADQNGQANPGDAIRYSVTISNTGTGPATGIVFTDAPDANGTLKPGSIVATQGTVVDGNLPGQTGVRVDIGTLAPDASATLQYQVIVDNPVPPGVTQLVNQGLVTGADFPDTPTNDPATRPGPDPTIFPIAQGNVPAEIPTLGGGWLIAFVGLLIAIGVGRMRHAGSS